MEAEVHFLSAFVVPTPFIQDVTFPDLVSLVPLRKNNWLYMGTAGLLHPYSFAFSRMLYKFYLFTMYWLCWVFVAAQAFSLVAESEGLCLAVAVGFSLQWLLLLRSAGSRAPGLQWFVMRAQ